MKVKLIAFLAVLLYATQVCAEKIKTIYLPEGFLAVKTPNGYSGAFPDILTEAAKRMERKVELQPAPWPRSQQNARQIPGAAVAPLTRVDEREDQYLWIEEIIPLNLTFIVLNSVEENIASLEDLKNKRIGVLRGSVEEVLTKKLNFPTKSIGLATSGQSLAKQLQYGRIDGWLIWDIYGLETLRSLDMDNQIKTTFSHRVGPLYLATNASVDAAEINAWRTALQDMKKDGTISSIFKNYYGDQIKTDSE